MFAVDVRLSPLISLAILFAHAVFLYAVIVLPLTCVLKMPFVLGIIISLAVSFPRCSSRHSLRIRRFIITRLKSLLITQQGAGALSGVAGIAEKAVPSLVRCGEFLIVLRFECVEKNGQPTVLRLWLGSLSRRDASLLRRHLTAKRGVLDSGAKMSVFGLRSEVRVIQREMQAA